MSFDVANFLRQRFCRTLTRLHYEPKTLPESFRVADHAGIVARVLMKAAKRRYQAVCCGLQVGLETGDLLLRFFPGFVFSFALGADALPAPFAWAPTIFSSANNTGFLFFIHKSKLALPWKVD
jgi:hypothetical protein